MLDSLFPFYVAHLQVLPIENKMKRPSELGGWTGVLNIGVTIAILLFSFIGFFGYLRFGDEIHGSITLNLPEDFWFVDYTAMLHVPATIPCLLKPGKLRRME